MASYSNTTGITVTQTDVMLSATNVTLAYDERIVCEHLGVDIPRGQISVIIGPNACGKSTLLRALSRLLTPQQGHVLLEGSDIHRLPTKALARKLGLLPQTSHAPSGITVGDLTARGRFPHQGFLQQWSEQDEAAVEYALRATELWDLVDRPVDELSGGQRQRVWIALLLAQDPGVLLLDEPTTYLDISNQLEVLELCRRLNRDQGRTIVLVLHELSLAARYADHVIVMSEGKNVASGPVAQVLTAELLKQVFHIEARIITDPVTGRPLVIPIRSTKEMA